MDQVAVRAVDVDDVEAGLHGPPGRLGVGLHELMALGDGELPGNLAARRRARHRRRRQVLESGHGGLRGAPAVVKFDGGERAFGVQGVREPAQAGDHRIRVQPQLVRAALAVGADEGGFGGDHPQSGLGPGDQVVDVLLRDGALGGAVVALHGGGGEPVAEGCRGAAVAAQRQGLCAEGLGAQSLGAQGLGGVAGVLFHHCSLACDRCQRLLIGVHIGLCIGPTIGQCLGEAHGEPGPRGLIDGQQDPQCLGGVLAGDGRVRAVPEGLNEIADLGGVVRDELAVEWWRGPRSGGFLPGGRARC